MNPALITAGERPGRLSTEGRARLLSRRGEPLFIAGWERVLFIHYEVAADELQRHVPFPLDLYEGRAYVSLVAFTMRDMRFRIGGKKFAFLLRPIATHNFLNVRTYVKCGRERGIYFITEWLSNWLSVQLGPLLYGLPYHYAKINYQHLHENNRLSGRVEAPDRGDGVSWEARFSPDRIFSPSESGSLAEFLLERYTAYTAKGSTARFSRIWHPPWPQASANLAIGDDALLRKTWKWFGNGQLAGANYSPGFDEVWMGRAHRVR